MSYPELKGLLAVGMGNIYLLAGPDLFFLLGDPEWENGLGATFPITDGTFFLMGIAAGIGYEIPLLQVT